VEPSSADQVGGGGVLGHVQRVPLGCGPRWIVAAERE
jgi:hypothetical protein